MDTTEAYTAQPWRGKAMQEAALIHRHAHRMPARLHYRRRGESRIAPRVLREKLPGS
jgi:hypothetical protein